MNGSSRIVHRFTLLHFCALVCLILMSGCASSAPRLTIKPITGASFGSATTTESYLQRFSRAYASVSDAGDYDIVLISEGLAASEQRGLALLPSRATMLKQVVHLHILWRPLPGTRTDQPTATNATIEWHVLSNLASASQDHLEYGGAGFVDVQPSRDGTAARISLRNATMKLVRREGDLSDPFGQCMLSGEFTAMRNDGLTHDILTSLYTSPTGP